VKTKVAALSPRVLVALAVAGVLLWAALAWLLYVSPHRSEASRLDEQLAAARVELAQAQVAAHHPASAGAPVADVFRLATAMPASSDQAGLVLELSRLAAGSGVTLRSITSDSSAAGTGGTTMIPVTVTVGGKFGQIARFLGLARSLVVVRRGKLTATGRLLSPESVELAESLTGGFPKLDATIVFDAYVYDGPIVPVTPPTTGDQSQSGSTTPSGSAAATGATG